MEYANIKWIDGQPFSDQYSDLYYSKNDGLSETEYVFIQQNNLTERFQHAKRFTVAEAGFGTGLNFIATCRHWLKYSSEDSILSYVGIEKNPISPIDMKRVADEWNELNSLYEELLIHYPLPVSGSHLINLFDGRVQLTLDFSNAEEALNGHRFTADVWFLDGFNPKYNLDMWNESFVRKIAQHSKPGTSLSTYTAAGHVRRGLEHAGFEVKKVKGHANKREMITAVFKQGIQYESELPWYDIPGQSYVDKTAIVVGAGIAGLTTALALLKKGWNVTLVDQHKAVAQEASGNPAGILLPRMNLGDGVEQQFYVNAFLYAVNLLDDLQKHSKTEFWFKTGVCSREAEDKAMKILELYESNCEFVKALDETRNAKCIHAYKSLMYPSAGWVRVDELCAEIYRIIENKINYVNSSVDGIKKVGAHWQVSDAGDSVASASVVIFATGQSLTETEMTSWLPIKAIRGQMTSVESNEKSKSLSHAFSFGRFLTPECKGIHYTGASYDINDMSSELSDLSQSENLLNLDNHFPDTFNHPNHLTGRVGFRVVTEDRMPIVGMVPDKEWFLKEYADIRHGKTTVKYKSARVCDGVYINGAHGSRGLSTSFISAELLLSMIEGTPSPISAKSVAALNPARFLMRRLKRNLKETV